MVGPGHCPMILKYGPLLSKAVGLVDPSFLVLKISHFNKKYSSYKESTNSTKQKVQVGCQYSKIQKHVSYAATQKRQKNDLNNKWMLNAGRKDCRMLPLEHSAILLTCIKP